MSTIALLLAAARGWMAYRSWTNPHREAERTGHGEAPFFLGWLAFALGLAWIGFTA